MCPYTVLLGCVEVAHASEADNVSADIMLLQTGFLAALAISLTRPPNSEVGLGRVVAPKLASSSTVRGSNPFGRPSDPGRDRLWNLHMAVVVQK